MKIALALLFPILSVAQDQPVILRAGAHGRNIEVPIYRVKEGGQDTKSAIISATSLAAESLRLGDKIGTIAPGMEADMIGVEGDPLKDVTVLRHVVFAMKGGRVYKK